MLIYRKVLQTEKKIIKNSFAYVQNGWFLTGNNLWLLKLSILVFLLENPVKDCCSHFSWLKLFTTKVLWKFVTQEYKLLIKFKPKLQIFISTSYEPTNCIYMPWSTSSSLTKNRVTNFPWIPLHGRKSNKLAWCWFAPWWYVYQGIWKSMNKNFLTKFRA